MKIRLVGKNLDDVRPLLAQFGMEEVSSGFELVLTHGGDGALLGAEREYPGVPKLALRDAATAPTCEKHPAQQRLRDFAEGRCTLTRLAKISGSWSGGEILALNDVFLHSASRSSALRYRVWIDDELYADEVFGDAVGLSSVHGSSAYYRSITHSLFQVGIGLSFSNSTEEVNHIVLAPQAVVKIEILRGPGLLVADNAPEIRIAEGEIVIFRESSNFAQIYALRDFMCSACRRLRHPGRAPFAGL